MLNQQEYPPLLFSVSAKLLHVFRSLMSGVLSGSLFKPAKNKKFTNYERNCNPNDIMCVLINSLTEIFKWVLYKVWWLRYSKTKCLEILRGKYFFLIMNFLVHWFKKSCFYTVFTCCLSKVSSNKEYFTFLILLKIRFPFGSLHDP